MGYSTLINGVRRAELARRRINKWQRIMREANERQDTVTIDKVAPLLVAAHKSERRAQEMMRFPWEVA